MSAPDCCAALIFFSGSNLSSRGGAEKAMGPLWMVAAGSLPLLLAADDACAAATEAVGGPSSSSAGIGEPCGTRRKSSAASPGGHVTSTVSPSANSARMSARASVVSSSR
eukprot:116570-Chlamydomonas_euryale.AAC.5